MIVIFSGAEDVHSLAVQSEIRKRGGDAVIVDLRGYRANLDIEHVIGAGSRGISVCLKQHGIDPVDVTGAWWRRVSRPEILNDLDEATNAFMQKEIDTTLKGWLLSMTNIINPVDRAAQANNKLLQLHIAQESGFCIPQTLVTTRKDSILRFRDRVGDIVCKPMNGHAQAFIETRLVRPDEDIDDQALSNCPTMFQEAILGGDDLRVTVIDDAIFAARVLRPEGFTHIDWRPELNATFASVALPSPVEDCIRRYMASMGLRYGAFDLRTDSAGRHVFLECNEAGQFLFVEIHGDIPISAAVAAALVDGPA